MWNKWYSQTFVLFEIIKLCKNREIVWLQRQGRINIRPLKIFSLSGLKYYFEKFRMMEKKYDFYYSSAHFENLPNSSPSPKKMRESRIIMKKNFDNMFVGYDFVLDIDFPDIKEAQKSTIKVVDLFNKMKLPFSLKFSGNKGFHIVIDQSHIPNQTTEFHKTAYSIAENIANYLEIPFTKGRGIDNSIYTNRSIYRVPYTLHGKTGLVAFPLTDQELMDFDKKQMTVNYLLEKKQIMNRGLLERKANGKFKRLEKEFAG